ncbi:MAG: preprotein translocase subunit SecA [Sedimenticola sp.]
MSVPHITMASHPGIAYPERSLERQKWYEAPVRALLRSVSGPLIRSSKRYTTIVRLTAGHADAMASLSDSSLRECALGLGRRLRMHGFIESIVAEAFALIREASDRVLGQRHYDVQLVGAWVLLHGKVAEMDTGEGKTLTATLTAATAALAGLPVHVITANDYLAERDAAEMEPLYQMLGLTVGNPQHGMNPPERRAAYLNHIVYCSNKEIAFDFLRDRISIGRRSRRLSVCLERLADVGSELNSLILRGLCFAIVDEADSVLVDEARTPLIISSSGEDGDPGGIYLLAISLAQRLESGSDFIIHSRERRVEITDSGLDRLAEFAEDLDGIWHGPRRRQQLITQALSALYLYQCDDHYLIRDDKVQIIDEYTGRILEDRSWEQGLHQMVEAKEQVQITAPRESLARTSYQHFFRRYLHLCGMSGTAKELASELTAVYGLDVIRVPTNRPCQRRQLSMQVFSQEQEKWQSVAERVADLSSKGRPILIGTRTVAASESASDALHGLGIPHRILSASQDKEEADVIAVAGQRGQVTVATNMAGRGTDIKLAPGISELGGLHVFATELHDSRRIDRQLFGRCARQGDQGSHEYFLSLEDELITTNLPSLLRIFLRKSLGVGGGELLTVKVLRLAQRRAERHNFGIRRQLLKSDEQLEDSLAYSGPNQ